MPSLTHAHTAPAQEVTVEGTEMAEAGFEPRLVWLPSLCLWVLEFRVGEQALRASAGSSPRPVRTAAQPRGLFGRLGEISDVNATYTGKALSCG